MPITKEVPKISLKPEVLRRVRKNKQLKRALTDLFDIDPTTLIRWIKKKDASLCRYDSLQVICSYLEIDDVEDCIESGVEKYLS